MPSCEHQEQQEVNKNEMHRRFVATATKKNEGDACASPLVFCFRLGRPTYFFLAFFFAFFLAAMFSILPFPFFMDVRSELKKNRN